MSESTKKVLQKEKSELVEKFEGDAAKQQALDQYKTAGVEFAQSYVSLQKSIKDMQGKPTSVGFRSIRDCAGIMACKAELLAGLIEFAEKPAIVISKRSAVDQKIIKMASNPKDTTMEQV